MKYRIALAFAIGVVGTACADTLPGSLLHCDSRFFGELYNQRISLNHTAPLKTDNAHHAWFISEPGNPVVWFSQPIKSGVLSVSGYWQDKSNLDEMGKYYFWGVLLDDSPEAVMAAFPKVHWQKSGENGEYFANPMIKQAGSNSQWQVNTGSASGIAPAKGSVEKLVLLDTWQGKTRLLCSVQGSVTAEDILPVRPDLEENK